MEISTLLIPCSVQGCVQGGNNLVNTMELQSSKHLVPLIKCVLSMLHYNGFYIGEFHIWTYTSYTYITTQQIIFIVNVQTSLHDSTLPI